MDSVSQIVLGAAVGEVVLGKKLGNKAMFWGAVGGTIPDLDIITKPLMTELESLAFHRGISHSIVFAILGGLLSGWLCYRLYKSAYSRQILYGILSLFMTSIPISITYFLFGNDWNPYVVTGVAVVLATIVFLFLLRKISESDTNINVELASLRSWQLMFFLAYLTHALLDTMTMYGTQLFLPFSNYRAAIGSISVADPFGYTLPFIFCLVMASRKGRLEKGRRVWTWVGIGLSSLYLLFTVYHKSKITKIFKQQLTENNITYDRMVVGPTIFNNFLWSMTAEGQDDFYMGQYSIFDTSPIYFRKIEKRHHLLAGTEEDKTIMTLRWFSNGFYNVLQRKDGLLQINDLRFGTFRESQGEDDFIFRFLVEQQAEGHYEMQRSIGGPDEDETTEIFGALWNRIKGR